MKSMTSSIEKGRDEAEADNGQLFISHRSLFTVHRLGKMNGEQ
jgi:hypothetical protein